MTRVTGLLALAIGGGIAATPAQAAPAPPRFDAAGRAIGPAPSARVANYVIEARLDPKARRVEGTATLTWTNASALPQRVLWFHAYWNAFKNARSTFITESRRDGNLRDFSPGGDDEDWGWTVLRSARLPDGRDVRSTLAWQRPDDGNSDDQTVFTLELPEPVPAGGTVTLALAWEARVPKLSARTGHHRGFFLLGQWFPKIGVLEVPPQRGVRTPTWNCHQFHAVTEFYADFGTYDVRLTVPRSMVVGATGVRTLRRENADGTVTHGFHQDDVIDFAWTAWDGFVERTDTLRVDGLPEVAITVLVPASAPETGRQLLAAARATLEYGGRHWMPYPYPHVTVVGPPLGANESSGGMEYPTFVTALSRTDPAVPRDWILWETVAHELGHNWFQSLLASNEFEEAWMDEGITTWATAQTLESLELPLDLADQLPPGLRGALRPFLTTRIADRDVRPGFAPRFDTPLAWPAWQFRTTAAEQSAAYARPAAALWLLESRMGRDALALLMRTYTTRWAFRHPGTDDFLAVVAEVGGPDAAALGQALFHGTAGLDDAVTEIRCEEVDRRSNRGFVDGDAATPVLQGPPPRPDPDAVRHVCEVLVERKGDLAVPSEVRVDFETGASVTEPLGPGERWHRWRYQRTKAEGGRVERARVHPAGPLRLDAVAVNDGRSRKATPTPVLRIAGWMLSTAQLVAAALGSLL